VRPLTGAGSFGTVFSVTQLLEYLYVGRPDDRRTTETLYIILLELLLRARFFLLFLYTSTVLFIRVVPLQRE